MQESSVEKFGAVHAKVKEGHNEEELTTRGASLRELGRFFKENDKNKDYAGLHRIIDEDGAALWTNLKGAEVAAQLEMRQKKRREEKSVSEYYSARRARMLQGPTGAASNEAEGEARHRAELKVEVETEASSPRKGRAVPASEASEALLSEASEALLSEPKEDAPKSSCDCCSLL